MVLNLRSSLHCFERSFTFSPWALITALLHRTQQRRRLQTKAYHSVFSDHLVVLTKPATHLHSTDTSTRPAQSWTSTRPHLVDQLRCRSFSNQMEGRCPTSTAKLFGRNNTARSNAHLASRASATSKPEFGHHVQADSLAHLVRQSTACRVLRLLTSSIRLHDD
jgi:hypothetical protein